ncbi:MAG: WG repeat-containing protein, partial [Crocinitomicaceae bacterium]|nr:WG repeat-containing protein [Crocinitomicaceae bacterium]
ESYVNFINSNPNSPLRILAEESVFEISTSSNTAASFNNFIVTYPKNRFVDTAWVQLYQFELSNFSTEMMKKFLLTDIPFKSRIRRDIALFDSIALPYSLNSKYGFMNEDGEVMIESRYDFTGFFQEGLAIVALNNKYGFINKHGDLQIPCIYESVNDFNDGLAIVERKGKMGMIDRNGRLLFECIYEDLGVFSEGMAYASLNEKYGYYDVRGKEVIPHLFDDAYDFHDGLANVENEGKQAIINQGGAYEIPLAYSEIKLYYDTLYTFEEDGFYGIMNREAQMFVEPIYTAISSVHNGLAVASIQGRVVYLDTLGTMVIDNGYQLFPNYLLKGEFVDGVSITSKKGKYGRINLKDEVVTDFKFENMGLGIEHFPAQKDGLWGVYNSKGGTLVDPLYGSLIAVDNGNYIASRNDTVGVIDSEGNTIVPFSFSEVESMGSDLFMVKHNMKVGIYKNEKLIVRVQYDQIGVFDKDFLFLSKAGRLLYYNTSTGMLIKLTD